MFSYENVPNRRMVGEERPAQKRITDMQGRMPDISGRERVASIAGSQGKR